MDPRYFRRLTDEANQGQKDREAAAREVRIQKQVNDAVGKAPRLAEDAAKKGESKVWVYEIETSTRSPPVSEDQEVVRRLTEHFTNKGFKVLLEGPGVDGGPTHITYWWGLSISW